MYDHNSNVGGVTKLGSNLSKWTFSGKVKCSDKAGFPRKGFIF